jgi:hypothetical protein
VSSRNRGRISGQFAPRLVEMLESPAYRVASLSARRVIDRVEIELAHHGGKDNGKLPVTFDNFVTFGMDRHSVAPGIRESVALGFLRVTEAGRSGNAEWRRANLFRLTYRESKGLPGDGTHEWRAIATMDDAADIARAARRERPANKKQNPSGGFSRKLVEKTHHKQRPHSGKTPTTDDSGKIPTTLDISGTTAAKPARDARPPKGAVASGQAAQERKPFVVPLTPSAAAERPEAVQSRLAGRLCAGPDGWVILQRLGEADPAQLERLTISESRGELTDADLEVVRAGYRRAVA